MKPPSTGRAHKCVPVKHKAIRLQPAHLHSKALPEVCSHPLISNEGVALTCRRSMHVTARSLGRGTGKRSSLQARRMSMHHGWAHLQAGRPQPA